MPDFNGELERHTEVAVNPRLGFRTEPSLFRASDPDLVYRSNTKTR